MFTYGHSIKLDAILFDSIMAVKILSRLGLGRMSHDKQDTLIKLAVLSIAAILCNHHETRNKFFVVNDCCLRVVSSVFNSPLLCAAFRERYSRVRSVRLFFVAAIVWVERSRGLLFGEQILQLSDDAVSGG